MELYEGKIFGYNDDEILSIIQNLPQLEEIKISLPTDIDNEFKEELIDLIKEYLPFPKENNITIINTKNNEKILRKERMYEQYIKQSKGAVHITDWSIIRSHCVYPVNSIRIELPI